MDRYGSSRYRTLDFSPCLHIEIADNPAFVVHVIAFHMSDNNLHILVLLLLVVNDLNDGLSSLSGIDLESIKVII